MIGNLLVKTGTNMTYYIAVANDGPSTADLVTSDGHFTGGDNFCEFRVRHRILQLLWRPADLFDHAPQEFLRQRCRHLQYSAT